MTFCTWQPFRVLHAARFVLPTRGVVIVDAMPRRELPREEIAAAGRPNRAMA
jgi:hypothetical protein